MYYIIELTEKHTMGMPCIKNWRNILLVYCEKWLQYASLFY